MADMIKVVFEAWIKRCWPLDGGEPSLMNYRRRRLRESLPELRGHNLCCWCKLLDEEGNQYPCHADVLLELANKEERCSCGACRFRKAMSSNYQWSIQYSPEERRCFHAKTDIADLRCPRCFDTLNPDGTTTPAVAIAVKRDIGAYADYIPRGRYFLIPASENERFERADDA